MARCRIGAAEQPEEKEKETAQPAELEITVPREDHPDQEDHKPHHREPLPMQPDTEIQCNNMKFIIRIMHINRIIAIPSIIVC